MVPKADAVTTILWSHRYYKDFFFRPNKSPLRSLMKLLQLRFENITLTNWITDKSAPSEQHPAPLLINTPFQSQRLHVQPVTDRFNKTAMSKFLDSTSMTHLSLSDFKCESVYSKLFKKKLTRFKVSSIQHFGQRNWMETDFSYIFLPIQFLTSFLDIPFPCNTDSSRRGS